MEAACLLADVAVSLRLMRWRYHMARHMVWQRLIKALLTAGGQYLKLNVSFGSSEVGQLLAIVARRTSFPHKNPPLGVEVNW